MGKVLIGLFVVVLAIFNNYQTQSYAEEAVYRKIEDEVPTVVVEGVGKITANPDEALVRLGIVNEEKSLKRAFKRQTEEMNRVIKEIKTLGIKEEDIKTTCYNVIPMYKGSTTFWGRRKPTSFEVSHELAVKVKDLSKLGDVIDKVIDAGAIYIYGLEFKSSKIEELEREVRLKAVEDAKEKARILAKGAGFKLGRALRVFESAMAPRLAFREYRPARQRKLLIEQEAAPQVEPGTLELIATCGVIYEITE